MQQEIDVTSEAGRSKPTPPTVSVLTTSYNHANWLSDTLDSVARQEYPHIELTLTDLTGQAAARRVLRPADYLGHAPAMDEAFAARSELALQLRLATPGIHPTGYQLLLFYP